MQFTDFTPGARRRFDFSIRNTWDFDGEDLGKSLSCSPFEWMLTSKDPWRGVAEADRVVFGLSEAPKNGDFCGSISRSDT